jgi:hypothetical protein
MYDGVGVVTALDLAGVDLVIAFDGDVDEEAVTDAPFKFEDDTDSVEAEFVVVVVVVVVVVMVV